MHHSALVCNQVCLLPQQSRCRLDLHMHRMSCLILQCRHTVFGPALQVFSGEVDESVRHEQLLLEGEIMRMFKLLDMSINHQVQCGVAVACT